MVDPKANIIESESAFKALFQYATTGILIADANGLIKKINPIASKIFGYSNTELYDEPIEKLIPQSLREKHKAYVMEYFKSPKNREMGQGLELFALSKSGKKFPVEISLGHFEIEGEKLAVAFINDIQKRKESEKEIKEQNRKFQTLISNLPGVVYRCRNDKNWSMEFISDRCLKLTGYHYSDFIKGTIHMGDLIEDSFNEYVWENVQNAIKSNKPFELKYQIKCRDGNIKWISEEGRGVFNTRGELVAIEGFMTDITEKEEAYIALNESEERFRLAAEGASAGIWEWNILTGEERWSDTWYALLGYEPAAFPANFKNFEKRLHPVDLSLMHKILDAHFKKKAPFAIEYRLKCRDGNYKWFFATGQAKWNEKGEPVWMAGSIVDINERKIAENKLQDLNSKLELKVSARTKEIKAQREALEKSYFKFRLLNEIGQEITSKLTIESIVSTVFKKVNSLMDAPEFRIGIYNNERGVIAFKNYFSEVKENPLLEVSMKEEDHLAVYCIKNKKEIIMGDVTNEYKNYISSLKAYKNENKLNSLIYIPLKTGDTVFGMISVHSFKKYAYSRYHVNLLRNLALYVCIAIENSKSYEKISSQNQQLESMYHKQQELDEFKEAMTGMIVHDFKNHLNTIINYTESIPDKLRSQSIHQAGKLMLSMVHNMLDVQKFEETKVDFEKEVLSINKVVKEAVDEVKFLIEQKSIKFSYHSDKKLYAAYDFELILRVFVNMLTNAIKYTPVNGRIKLIVGERENYLKISFKDTGRGIPKIKQDLIFDKYGQVEAKKYGKVHSSGLGLTYCKMVIEAHGGKIGVDSEVGKGSTFWFTIEKIDVDSTIKESEEVTDFGIKEDAPIKLSKEDREFLIPYINQFKKFEVYDFSEVKDLIFVIKAEGCASLSAKSNSSIHNWLEALTNAVNNLNEDKYEAMLNDI